MKGNFHRKVRRKHIKKSGKLFPHRFYDEIGINVLENPEPAKERRKQDG